MGKNKWEKRVSLGVLSLAVLSLMTIAGTASGAERSGKEVVEAVCSHCHGTGKDGAPRLDDRAAWTKRASQGLSHLSDHAILGIGKMPAHGGQPALTDLEVSRAIAYMVSGGHAIDPAKPYSSPQYKSGEQLVQERCRECHGSGKDGAPRIGDMADWKPRLSAGVDSLVKSAISGHNSMPARGGLAGISDAETRGALIFMLAQSAAMTLRK